MIPKNITKNHILDSIREVDKNGVPKGRNSRKFKLVYRGKTYPPKYVISLANKYASVDELEPSDFGGGRESNDFLVKLGFEIVTTYPFPKNLIKSPERKTGRIQSKLGHNERCSECKQTIGKMLKKIYVDVKSNYKFDLKVYPDDFITSLFYNNLKDICATLQKYRGHNNFIRMTNLPRVDYYVPNPGIIVEFDESQHFTSCRKESLLKYPETLQVGFDTHKWIELCDNINAKDNKPPYRDEQRAWYDTLRDFLPAIKQLNPTIRLFSRDYRWCSLNPEQQSDVRKFKILLSGKMPHSDIEVKKDIDPFLARIVISGKWDCDVNTAKRILHKICDKWPKGNKVKCLITCGAFLNFDWPKSLNNVGNNLFPHEKALYLLKTEALKQCDLLIDEELRKKLLHQTDYITIGIDSRKDKISLSNVLINQFHAEMVAILDLRTKQYFWTGKSYPTAGQENGLVRFQNLDSHFLELSFGKVMMLGCHDLNVFSPRGKVTTRKNWRKKIRKDFYKIIKQENPKIVLHHPHTTDSSRIWTPAWNELVKIAPTIKEYISAGRFFNKNGVRSKLNNVLSKTKLGNTIDFIVNIKE